MPRAQSHGFISGSPARDGCTTTRLLGLHRRADYGAEGAEDTAITLQWTEQRVTFGALVEELTGVRRHPLALRMSALGAGDGRLKLNAAHCADATLAGNPALVVASISAADWTRSGSKITVAVFLSMSTEALLTPGTRSRALRTTMGQVPQVMFLT